MCRLLHISRSGFYAWLDRPMSERARSDLALTGKIEAIHRRSNGAYGSPNIHAELADDHGIRVGRKRVARLMRAAGLRGATLRRYVVTTLSDPQTPPDVDLVKRQFYTDGPDRLWVADITYIPTWSGFLYLAIVLDVYSRRIVGWAMETHLRTELILAALNMAITQRRPQAVIHHSDHGSTQATPLASAAVRPASCPRWDRSAMPTTTRWRRAFSLRSSGRCWTAVDSRARPKRRWPFLSGSKVGTTRIGVIPR
jgi:putative transposase